MMQSERRVVTINDACQLVGVSRRSIYNWLRAGKIESVRTAGGAHRIYVDSLWRHIPKFGVHVEKAHDQQT